MKCILVDDEKGSRDVLAGFLKKYCPDVQVAGQAENVYEAYDLIIRLDPDVVFLDISMPDCNGFELLDKFPNVEFEVIIVTAHEEYALRAIKNNAIDYILKPIGIAELKDAISRADRRVKHKTQLAVIVSPQALIEKITIPVRDGFIYVNISDIIRCEADGGYTWIHLNNKEKILVTKTLKEFEVQLVPNKFVRIHHHHLINLQYVTRYHQGRGGKVLMADGGLIEVSQRRRTKFFDLIGVKQ